MYAIRGSLLIVTEHHGSHRSLLLYLNRIEDRAIPDNDHSQPDEAVGFLNLSTICRGQRNGEGGPVNILLEGAHYTSAY